VKECRLRLDDVALGRKPEGEITRPRVVAEHRGPANTLGYLRVDVRRRRHRRHASPVSARESASAPGYSRIDHRRRAGTADGRRRS
jgi:hypothetical protein